MTTFIYLSQATVAREQAILNFVDREMRDDDLLLVASPSGKIGFLQQFTDNKAVLRAAVERLRFSQDFSATDYSPPPMTLYEALLIDRYDPDVTRAFIKEYMRLG